MGITKKILEERLHECRQVRSKLAQDNAVLQRELNFITKLTPNASMIIAVERVTEALAHTIQYLTKR